MSGLRGRLERLKDRAGQPCVECGDSPGGPVQYDVVVVDGSVPADEGPDSCAACGQPLVYEVGWPDVDQGGG